jgi:hypothetical protein
VYSKPNCIPFTQGTLHKCKRSIEKRTFVQE